MSVTPFALTEPGSVRAGSARRPVRREPGWSRAALLACSLLALGLYTWGLGRNGYGNAYYAAAVRSMGKSWENFFFGAFDPLGFVTVDKPPAALWPQVLSAKLFGYSGWAVLLPQVVEGVLTVVVLHRTVLRWAGPAAASLAALVFALTPISVAVNRDNNPDTLLVLLLVCAAYAVTRAVDAARPVQWLVLGAAFVGAAFTTKMLQAWVVVPALVLAYLVGARAGVWRRVGHLAVAGVTMVVTSFAWVAAVDLWPGDKPYIGGSRDGSAWDLVIGYNGLGRVFGNDDGSGPGLGNAGPSFGGMPGWSRLFNDQIAGQISWLLPLCAAALVAAAVRPRMARRVPLPAAPPAAGWVLWAGWLGVAGLVFSFAQGIFHQYYTSQLAPAVAALCGAGLIELWRLYRARARGAWLLLPLGLAATGGWAVVVAGRTPDWQPWVIPAVGVLAVVALALLSVGRRGIRRLGLVGATAGVAAALVAPTVWAVSVPAGVSGGMNGVNPTAGPMSMSGPGGGPGGRGGRFPRELPAGLRAPGGGQFPGGGRSPGGGQLPGGGEFPGFSGGPGMRGGGLFGGNSGRLDEQQRRVLGYARAHRGNARILLAAPSSTGVAPYIIATGETVISLGGFNGSDQAVTLAELRELVATGQLRFVTTDGFLGAGADRDERLAWITRNCRVVNLDADQQQGQQQSQQPGQRSRPGGSLYDCAPSGRSADSQGTPSQAA